MNAEQNYINILVGSHIDTQLLLEDSQPSRFTRRMIALTYIYQYKTMNIAGYLLMSAQCGHRILSARWTVQFQGFRNLPVEHFAEAHTVFISQMRQLSNINYYHRGLLNQSATVFDIVPEARVGFKDQYQAGITTHSSPAKFRSTCETYLLFTDGQAYSGYTAIIWLLTAARESHLHETVVSCEGWQQIFGDHAKNIATKVARATTWTHMVVENLLRDVDLDTNFYKTMS